MFENGVPVRKVVIWGVAGLVLFFVLVFVFRLLTTGSITVTTNSRSGIVSLKSLNAAADSTNIKSAKHTLSLRLKPGQYLISAASHNSGVSKVVTVKARQSTSYTLTIPTPALAEPVIPDNATSLVADSQQLFYVNSGGILNRLDTSNNIQDGYGSLSNIKAAVWSSTALGVIQTTDNSLYIVSNGSVQALQPPVKIPGSASSHIDLSRDGTLVFTNGGDVYSGKIGQIYKHIYKSGDQKVRVAAGGKNTAIIEALNKGKGGEGNDRVVVIDISGNKTVKEMGAQQAGWSPSGKYLFVADKNGGNYVYDSSLKLVRTLVSTPFGAFTWTNDDALAYGLGSGLWLYSVSGGQAYGISNMNGDAVRLISASSDGSYIYVVTDFSGQAGTGRVWRVGLKNQSVPNYLQALNVFLPENVGVCALSYVNFTKPVITAQYPAATTTPDFCTNAAKGEIQYYGLNSDKFSFSATPQSRGE